MKRVINKAAFRAGLTAAVAIVILLVACRQTGTDRSTRAAGGVHMDLGITYLAVTPGVVTDYALAGDRGVVITDIAPGGLAARGGLEVGDVILTFDGTPLDGDHPLLSLLMDCPEGETMTVEILRAACPTTLELPAD